MEVRYAPITNCNSRSKSTSSGRVVFPRGLKPGFWGGLFMYGLKPVPFKLKPEPFKLKPEPFKLKPEPFKLKPVPFIQVGLGAGLQGEVAGVVGRRLGQGELDHRSVLMGEAGLTVEMKDGMNGGVGEVGELGVGGGG